MSNRQAEGTVGAKPASASDKGRKFGGDRTGGPREACRPAPGPGGVQAQARAGRHGTARRRVLRGCRAVVSEAEPAGGRPGPGRPPERPPALEGCRLLPVFTRRPKPHISWVLWRKPRGQAPRGPSAARVSRARARPAWTAGGPGQGPVGRRAWLGSALVRLQGRPSLSATRPGPPCPREGCRATWADRRFCTSLKHSQTRSGGRRRLAGAARTGSEEPGLAGGHAESGRLVLTQLPPAPAVTLLYGHQREGEVQAGRGHSLGERAAPSDWEPGRTSVGAPLLKLTGCFGNGVCTPHVHSWRWDAEGRESFARTQWQQARWETGHWLLLDTIYTPGGLTPATLGHLPAATVGSASWGPTSGFPRERPAPDAVASCAKCAPRWERGPALPVHVCPWPVPPRCPAGTLPVSRARPSWMGTRDRIRWTAGTVTPTPGTRSAQPPGFDDQSGQTQISASFPEAAGPRTRCLGAGPGHLGDPQLLPVTSLPSALSRGSWTSPVSRVWTVWTAAGLALRLKVLGWPSWVPCTQAWDGVWVRPARLPWG
ncbi:uncharacterized protein LOC119231661 [Talpa occidentalis]|uniref:uncharacterized protein LOC119231661 n=1 Tax=Talpa occidentalis TaxID=50954 RepID=UPI00188FFB7E|nr:uncharacterized protein LOC119231661 [Talpa occidentalis]